MAQLSSQSHNCDESLSLSSPLPITLRSFTPQVIPLKHKRSSQGSGVNSGCAGCDDCRAVRFAVGGDCWVPWGQKLSRALNAAKRRLQTFARPTSQPNRRAVDGGNVSACVLTGTQASSDCFHACPPRFTFRFAPMSLSGFPNYRDADEIHPATVAVDADHSCQSGQSTTTGSH